MSDSKETKKIRKESVKSSMRSVFVTVIIGIVIVAFIIGGGPMLGINDFVKDIGKRKIKNENGTFSIPDDAQTGKKANDPNSYIGKVLNQKIQLGKKDEFTNIYSWIYNDKKTDPYTKIAQLRYYFEHSINKIIGMKNARELNLIISKGLLTKEVGKRHFSDSSGDPDFNLMRKNTSRVNELAKETHDVLLYKNFENDSFDGLPLSKDEVSNYYRIKNLKVGIKYVYLTNSDINEEKLKQFFELNKTEFKTYKLTKLVFKDKKEAEKALSEIKNDSKKFIELGNKLKSEDKVINIVYDPVFSFVDEFENDALKKAVKTTNKGNIYQAVIEISVGQVIVKIEDINDSDYNSDKVKQKVKSNYVTKNKKELDGNLKNLALSIVEESRKNGLDRVAEKNKLKVESTQNQIAFMSGEFPFANPDATDDLNYLVKVYKSKKGDVLDPFKYESGYMIATVTNKTEVSDAEIESIYDEIYKNYSQEKTNGISNDYYTKERKKYEIIDNFSYVFNQQHFMQKEEN